MTKHFILALALLLGVAVGSAGTWYFMLSNIVHCKNPINTLLAEPCKLNREAPSLIIRQAGKILNTYSLVKQFKLNPNSFSMFARRGEFSVSGRIKTISEYDPVPDQLSGFYVPLITGGFTEQDLDAIPGISTPNVSLFVKGVDENSASQLQVGQAINVYCKGLREVSGSLVFDDCRRKETTDQR